MKNNSKSKLTQAVHAGSLIDNQHKGMVSPIYPSSAYDYEGSNATLYPRYYNTPNQKAVVEKLCALEHAEDGLVFGSGMAAILTSIFAMLKAGDHALFQNDLYGGAYHAIVNELPRYGIGFSFVDGADPKNFENALQENTKIIYIETPSNPTLKITDIKAVAEIGKRHGVVTIIDSTFASPVNQNPIDWGIDIVTHSGTKYLGGHSDLSCGAVLSSKKLISKIWDSAIHFGGALDAQACWLLERSLKTLAIRVREQNKNALTIAQYLKTDARISRVYYPGLIDHADHLTAKSQMPGGFGGMLSFEVKGNAHQFMDNLSLIRRAISLGGVESTITSPAKTSHAKMSAKERATIGVTDNLVRLSVGIEEADDLINDIKQALD